MARSLLLLASLLVTLVMGEGVAEHEYHRERVEAGKDLVLYGQQSHVTRELQKPKPAIIKGRMWFDTNPENGKYDAKEKGVRSGIVKLFRRYRSPDGVFHIKKVGKDVKVRKDGTYKGKLRTIDAISEYFLRFSHSEETFSKFTKKGKDSKKRDSHVNPRGKTEKFKPVNGVTTVRNAGIVVGVIFRGRMWFDINPTNSLIDKNKEQGASNAFVSLWRKKPDGVTVLVQGDNVSGNGAYEFRVDTIEAGKYFLKFSHNEEAFNTFTRRGVGRDASHVDSNGVTKEIEPVGGKIYTRNAGIKIGAVFRGLMWFDDNVDSLKAGEQGVRKGSVRLFRQGVGLPVQVGLGVVTKSDGSFEIPLKTIVEGNNYYVTFAHKLITLGTYVFSPLGGDNDADENGNSIPNNVAVEQVYEIDAGIVPRIPPGRAVIYGNLWKDINGDNFIDNNERAGIKDGAKVLVYRMRENGTFKKVVSRKIKSNGRFLFSLGVPGTYFFRFRHKEGEEYVFIGRVGDSHVDTNGESARQAILMGVRYYINAGIKPGTQSPTASPTLIPTATPVNYRIDFDTYPDGSETHGGDYVSGEWLAYGVRMTASGGLGKYPRLFDSSNPGTLERGDPDLGSPNEKCPISGPGVGEGGEPDVAGANCEPQRRVLIIQEDNGFPEIPDDNEGGGVVSFAFTKPVTFHAIGLMDIDGNNAVVRVKYGGGIEDFPVIGAGDNSVQTVEVEREAVKKIKVRFDLSGAVTFIDYSIALDNPVPTASPTSSVAPSESPSESPSERPTRSPTRSPTVGPVAPPTTSPTGSPTASPTGSPTKSPTFVSPTGSGGATPGPTASSPTIEPTSSPTQSPTPRALGSLTGTIFNDLNNNRVRDTGEPGIEGVSVMITDSGGRTFNLTTDENGRYNSQIPSGSLVIDIVESTLPFGFEQTVGTNPTTFEVPGNQVASDIDGYHFIVSPTGGGTTPGPTASPTIASPAPSSSASESPSASPAPSNSPSESPSASPAPSSSPSESPSASPAPSSSPSESPSASPAPTSASPTRAPPTPAVPTKALPTGPSTTTAPGSS